MSSRESPPAPIPGVEIRERKRRDGTIYYVYRVRWKDPATGKRLVETLDTRQDALDFLAHLRLARRRGVLGELDQGRESLSDFAAEWWERYAKHNLDRKTRQTYASVWNRHLLPRVGHLQLRQITPAVVDRFKSDLQDDGVGAPTIRKAISLLQAILREAVAWDRLRLNPVRQIRKPRAPRQRAVVAVSPEQVEALREVLPTQRDQVLASGRRAPKALLFPRPDGRPWRETDYRNWRRRVFYPAAANAGLATLEQNTRYVTVDGKRRRRTKTTYNGLHPYDLRHSFASLLIREGKLSLAEIAEQLGNSVATLSDVYAHVIADMRGQARTSADDAILQARAIRQAQAQ